MSVSPTDRAQRASAAGGLLLGGFFVVLIVYGQIDGYLDRRAKQKELEGVLAQIDQIEASSDSPSLKSKKVLDLAYSNWDVVDAVNARHDPNYLLNRAGQHVQAGYQQTDPLTPSVFDKVASETCTIRVKRVDQKSPNFDTENFDGYRAAKQDFEAWRPYLADYDKAWDSCASIRDVGATVGEASGKVGEWWDSATKPLSDAVDEFKAGYQSGK
ncbi:MULTISPECIES: hypothetical protein [Rhizobium/Agrobacterium group]|uniref:Uncharacterized protein n=1 Tax=Agrobacterium genomosp. 2 str. CFBP 5494 TaxID=1183436 RepID=A0A9W5AZJ8_9HYPH|nr:MULTISPECIES: hypothetical protein [Rhizobium/Agrobacterium group]CAD7036243.1 hypothetical protein RP007_04430 [Rhizobium sp. P007]CUW88594.1 hypothetical protein AGR2A_Cc140110 [Agrobacterium genomosp. 2 str. CFBP 5494]